MQTSIRILWSYREFIKALVQREFKTRYTQSVLGLLWLVIEPSLLVATFTLVSILADRHAPNGEPFPVYFYSAMLIWRLFDRTLRAGTDAFIADGSLLTKLAFPRQISIIRAHIISLCDFLIESIVFVALLIVYQKGPTLQWLHLPFLLAVTLFLTHGLSLFLGTLNVFIRDIGILLGTATSILFWFTPIIFDFPPQGRTELLFWLNPIAGIVRNYRHVILGAETLEWTLLLPAIALGMVFNLLGVHTFQRLQKRFVDAL
jgi:lipopolysaccharide transport system permease protein